MATGSRMYVGASKFPCYCGEPAAMWQSGTTENPSRLFLQCGMQKRCSYWFWEDEVRAGIAGRIPQSSAGTVARAGAGGGGAAQGPLRGRAVTVGSSSGAGRGVAVRCVSGAGGGVDSAVCREIKNGAGGGGDTAPNREIKNSSGGGVDGAAYRGIKSELAVIRFILFFIAFMCVWIASRV